MSSAASAPATRALHSTDEVSCGWGAHHANKATCMRVFKASRGKPCMVLREWSIIELLTQRRMCTLMINPSNSWLCLVLSLSVQGTGVPECQG